MHLKLLPCTIRRAAVLELLAIKLKNQALWTLLFDLCITLLRRIFCIIVLRGGVRICSVIARIGRKWYFEAEDGVFLWERC